MVCGLRSCLPTYGALLTLSNYRTGDLSPRGVLVDEGFQDSGDLVLLTAGQA